MGDYYKKTAYSIYYRISLALLLVTVVAANGWGQTQLSIWNFQDIVTPADVVSNIGVSVVTISDGTINFQNGTDDGGSRIGNSGTWNQDGFSTTGKYLQFSLEPDNGYSIELTAMSLRFGRTAQGPAKITVQYSLDGFLTEGTTILYAGDVTSTNAGSLDAFNITTNLPSEAITEAVTIRIWGHNAVGSGNLRFNNFRVHGQVIPLGDVIATPVFNPGSGTHYEPFDLEITTATDYATIFYSFDSGNPETGTWVEYDDEDRPTIGETTTIKAYATKADMVDSDVANAEFIFPEIVEVGNIAALKAGNTNGTFYKLTGEVVLTFQTNDRNQKYIQDESGAILMDDEYGNITTGYEIYDGITGLIGSLIVFNNSLRFLPLTDPGVASNTNIIVIPIDVTLDNLNDDYQAKLVRVVNVTIEHDNDDNFESGKNYDLTDATGVGLLRANYSDLDYIGEPIPTLPQNITGVIYQLIADTRLVPRSLADFEIMLTEDPVLNANPSTLSDLNYIEGLGHSESKPFELTGANLKPADAEITIHAPASFEVSLDDNGFQGSVSVNATGGCVTQTIYARLASGLAVDEYSGNVAISGGSADNVNVAVTGTVTPQASGLPYNQNFAAFVSAETLPEGWMLDENYGYQGDFGSGTAGGLRGNGVLGFQLTGSAPNNNFTATLTFFNDTESVIDQLYVAYTGKVERTDQSGTPKWTVSVNGTAYAELEYSTSDGTDKEVAFLITGVNFEVGEVIEIEWFTTSAGTSGTRRQIGISNVLVDTEEPDEPADPTLAADPDVIADLNYLRGNGPSAPQSFKLSGTDLDGTDVTLTTPANFEASDAADGTYNETFTLPAFDGSETDIWVRLVAGLAIGDYDGNVSIAGGDAGEVTVVVSGTVVVPLIVNEDTGETYASIQDAVDDASPGDVIIIPAGAYTGDVNDNVGVAFAPGDSPGCVTINGDFTAIAATTFDIEIFGDNACAQYDRISVTGTLTLGGAKLNLTMGSYNPPDGKNYTIMTCGTLVGTFGAIQKDIPVDYDISYTGGQIVLSTPMDPAVIPIAPWTVFLLFGMMGAFVLRRFRK